MENQKSYLSHGDLKNEHQELEEEQNKENNDSDYRSQYRTNPVFRGIFYFLTIVLFIAACVTLLNAFSEEESSSLYSIGERASEQTTIFQQISLIALAAVFGILARICQAQAQSREAMMRWVKEHKKAL